MTISYRPGISRSSSGRTSATPPGESTNTSWLQFGSRKSSSHSISGRSATGYRIFGRSDPRRDPRPAAGTIAVHWEGSTAGAANSHQLDESMFWCGRALIGVTKKFREIPDAANHSARACPGQLRRRARSFHTDHHAGAGGPGSLDPGDCVFYHNGSPRSDAQRGKSPLIDFGMRLRATYIVAAKNRLEQVRAAVGREKKGNTGARPRTGQCQFVF